MSCPDGSCTEPGKRRRALVMLGLMMLVFIMLSAFSFLKSRGQVTPEAISYNNANAVDGKRSFQAYNCMDCHTIVGNGAYLAPDLTKIYKNAGPAWLAAFLPSAGQWPTEAAVSVQLMNSAIGAEAGVTTIADYYAKYPGAKERVERRGGQNTFMPNLHFYSGEVDKLMAFLKYTSAMNTEGWPPEVMTGPLQRRLELLHGANPPSAAAVPAAQSSAATEATPATPEQRGEQLAKSLGCLACHSTGDQKLVGPPWGNLYGSQVPLNDGTTVTADDAYLVRSIQKPNAQIVQGFQPGLMPPYEALLKDDQIQDIIAFIRSLGGHQ